MKSAQGHQKRTTTETPNKRPPPPPLPYRRMTRQDGRDGHLCEANEAVGTQMKLRKMNVVYENIFLFLDGVRGWLLYVATVAKWVDHRHKKRRSVRTRRLCLRPMAGVGDIQEDIFGAYGKSPARFGDPRSAVTFRYVQIPWPQMITGQWMFGSGLGNRWPSACTPPMNRRTHPNFVCCARVFTVIDVY